jgi:hypothetical protein
MNPEPFTITSRIIPAVLWAIVGFASAAPASATMVTFDFRWTITSIRLGPDVRFPFGSWWGNVSVGDRFWGSLTYDPSVPRESSGQYRLGDPVEQRIELTLASANHEIRIPGPGTHPAIDHVSFSIQNSPDGSSLAFAGAPSRVESMRAAFYTPPGITLDEKFFPEDLGSIEWSRTRVSVLRGYAYLEGYFEGEITSITRRVPDTGHTAVLLSVAAAALGWFRSLTRPERRGLCKRPRVGPQ